jgi:hypothetical protein
MNGDVGRGAERAIGMVRGTVSMRVRDLYRPQYSDQEDAEEREENSPGMVCALSLACMTHIRQMFLRGREPGCDSENWAWVQLFIGEIKLHRQI